MSAAAYHVACIYFTMVLGHGASATFKAVNRSYIFSGDKVGFSLWSRFMSAIVAYEILGRPACDFRRQYERKARLCHRKTVSGWTIISVDFQSVKYLDRKIHNRRKELLQRDFGILRFISCCWIVANWLRSAMFSRRICASDFKQSQRNQNIFIQTQ